MSSEAAYRDFWTVPGEDVAGKTGAAGLMDCHDIRDVLTHLDLDLADSKVLDVGCGTGRLSQLCREYVGVDVSPSMVDYAITHGGLSAYLISGPADLDTLPAFDCDFVTCLSVFTHIDRADRVDYLVEFRRLADELLVDILPGEDGGSISAWYANPAHFQADLGETGWTMQSSFPRTSADGHRHLYYHCR